MTLMGNRRSIFNSDLKKSHVIAIVSEGYDLSAKKVRNVGINEYFGHVFCIQ